jgi:hypothetical protein
MAPYNSLGQVVEEKAEEDSKPSPKRTHDEIAQQPTPPRRQKPRTAKKPPGKTKTSSKKKASSSSKKKAAAKKKVPHPPTPPPSPKGPGSRVLDVDVAPPIPQNSSPAVTAVAANTAVSPPPAASVPTAASGNAITPSPPLTYRQQIEAVLPNFFRHKGRQSRNTAPATKAPVPQNPIAQAPAPANPNPPVNANPTANANPPAPAPSAPSAPQPVVAGIPPPVAAAVPNPPIPQLSRVRTGDALREAAKGLLNSNGIKAYDAVVREVCKLQRNNATGRRFIEDWELILDYVIDLVGFTVPPEFKALDGKKGPFNSRIATRWKTFVARAFTLALVYGSFGFEFGGLGKAQKTLPNLAIRHISTWNTPGTASIVKFWEIIVPFLFEHLIPTKTWKFYEFKFKDMNLHNTEKALKEARDEKSDKVMWSFDYWLDDVGTETLLRDPADYKGKLDGHCYDFSVFLDRLDHSFGEIHLTGSKFSDCWLTNKQKAEGFDGNLGKRFKQILQTPTPTI